MEKFVKILMTVFIGILAGGCVYDYQPEDEDIQGLDKPLVVIDGDIVVGGITHVKIGLTQSLTADEDTIEVQPLSASVWVESESGRILSGVESDYNVNEFLIDTEDLSLQERYRLGVSIPGRGEYLSAFKSVLVAPAIDSITWSVANDRSYARIEVTTHNGKLDEKLYCKWSYSENWESNALYPSQLVFDVKSGVMTKLSPEETVTRQYCFSEAESVGTYIANTEKLSENVIYKSVVKEIANTDTRLMRMYSINVTQKVLDKEAYIYWDNMKNNTSGTGGLFSPQPSEIRGNIESVTTEGEIVIGYVNVSTVSQRRVFVDWTNKLAYSTGCVEILVPKLAPTDKPDAEPKPLWPGYYTQGYRPIRFSEGKTDEAYWALENCTDCRAFSNSTRPDFWPAN